MQRKKILPDFLQGLSLTLRLKHSYEHQCFYADDDIYWTYYSFDIVLQNILDDNIEDIVIGNLEARRFLAAKASVDNFCPHCAFDMSDCNVQQYIDMLWDHDTHDLSPIFANSLEDDCLWGDIFLLMSIDIFPQYRGYDLANAATWIFYRNFCTTHDIIVLLAFPLQFGITDEEKEKCKPEEFTGSLKECTTKLIKYYKKLGFKRIGRSNFMFFACEYTMIKPKILNFL